MLPSHPKLKVWLVTQENLSSVSVHDVVLPLPGDGVRYPENHDLIAIYEEELAKDGLTLDSFRERVHKQYALSGDYRRILGMVSRGLL